MGIRGKSDWVHEDQRQCHVCSGEGGPRAWASLSSRWALGVPRGHEEAGETQPPPANRVLPAPAPRPSCLGLGR